MGRLERNGTMQRTVALSVLAILVGAGSATAQYRGLRGVAGDAGSFGFNLAVGAPSGDFAQNVDVAGGIDAFGAVNLGAGNPLGLRFEVGYLVYRSDQHIDANTPHAITT